MTDPRTSLAHWYGATGTRAHYVNNGWHIAHSEYGTYSQGHPIDPKMLQTMARTERPG